MRRPPTSRPSAALLAVLVLSCLGVLAIWAARPCQAQPALAQAPTAGITLPAPSVASEPDATAVSLNPAGLALLQSWSAVYVHTSGLQDAVTTAGGDGLFLAARGFGPTAVGIGFENVRTSPDLVPYYDSRSRLTLAYALGAPVFSLGVAWHHFFDRPAVPGVASVDGVDAWDAGLVLRPFAYASLGVAVRDFTGETVGGVPVEATWVPELALRPLGSRRLELDVGTLVGSRRGDASPYVRLMLRPLAGLGLVAELRSQDILAPPGSGGAERRSWLATIGLDVSFGRAGAGGAYLTGPGGGPGGVSGWVRLSGESYPALVEPSHVGRLDLEGDLDDRKVIDIERRLDRAAGDPAVRGVLLDIDGLEIGWSSIEELRDAVHRLRDAGKPVYAFITEGGTRDYYLASACERIYQSPAGGIRLVGLSSAVFFVKDTLDKLGVLAQFIKIGAYKSAPEMFTDTQSSGPAREERDALLDDIYGQLVADLAHDRGLTADRVKALIDAGPYTAKEALDARLVDRLATEYEVDDDVHERLGEYPSDLDEGPRRHDRWLRPKIAVVYIDGDIVDGASSTGPLGGHVTGAGTIVETLDGLREKGNVRAVVLRVNSPGGSALGSDRIDEAVRKLEKEGVPVIASMGDLAASGGYFVLADAGAVFAEPATLTGSIGIFTGKFDVSGLATKVGVGVETDKRGAHADEESLFRPYTAEEQAQILAKLQYFYGRFVGAVARGRKLAAARVDELGRGRVWSGERALALDLADEKGGFLPALAEAKRRAGLAPDADVELLDLPRRPRSLLELLASLIGADGEEDRGAGVTRAPSMLPAWLPPFAGPTGLPAWMLPLARALPASLLLEPSRPLARLPYSITLQ